MRLPCWIVDDGSEPAARQVAEQIAQREADWVTLVRHPANRGKGAAVMSGCRAAHAAGFTHALQIDADAQHDFADVPRLLAAAESDPQALVLGVAHYDTSVPRARRYGRYLTHLWVWINTLSLEIRDTMCGLRVYPLAALLALTGEERVGERMDFDTEVVVRLHWRGLRVLGVPTRVTYPRDGISHFRLWHDNLLITAMHTRLFFGMLWRLPRLLSRPRRAVHRA